MTNYKKIWYNFIKRSPLEVYSDLYVVRRCKRPLGDLIDDNYFPQLSQPKKVMTKSDFDVFKYILVEYFDAYMKFAGFEWDGGLAHGDYISRHANFKKIVDHKEEILTYLQFNDKIGMHIPSFNSGLLMGLNYALGLGGKIEDFDKIITRPKRTQNVGKNKKVSKQDS